MRPICRTLPLFLFCIPFTPRLASAADTAEPETSSSPPGEATPEQAPAGDTPVDKSSESLAPTASAATPPSDAVIPPQILHYEAPELPSEIVVTTDTAVDLQLTISADGEVTDARALDSNRSPLTDAAVNAARKFRFSPARQADVPVPVLIQYRFWIPATPLPTPPATEYPLSVPTNDSVDRAPHAPDPGPPTPLASGAVSTDDIYEAVAEVKAPAREPTRRSISREQLTIVPGTRGDPIRSVELLPGVGRAPEGSLPILRGASPSESVTFLDGTSIPFLYHFGSVTSVIHPRLIEQVDVIPSNFSPRYGRVTGGVIEAKLRKPRNDRFGFVADINLVDSSLLVESPLGEKTSLALSGRRSNIDFVFDNFVPSGAFDVIAAPLYWDYQAVLQHDFSADSFLRIVAFGAQDKLQFVFAEPSQEDPQLRGEIKGGLAFHRVQVLHHTTFGAVKQRAQISVGLQDLEQQLGPASAYFNIHEGDARLEWEVPLSPAASLTVGFDTSAQWLTGAYRGAVPSAQEGALPGGRAAHAVVDRSTISLVNPAAYVEAHLYPVDDWLLLPGIRTDYIQQTNSFTVNPRLNQRFELTMDTTLKAGVGLYSQPPQYYELLLPWGNPALNPYHALHTSFGAEHHFAPGLDVDAEVFYKYLYQRVVGTEGGTPPGFVNDGSGRIYGFELGGTYAPTAGLFARVAYTLSRSERRDRDEAWRLFDYDQTHVLSLASGYQLGAGWQVGGRYRYVTGNPHTPVTGATFDATSGVYVPSFADINSGRDPAFSQLDLRLEKQFSIGPGSLSVYLDVQNVLASDNKEGFSYSYDYTQREGVSIGPFLPNLGLRGEL